MHNYIKPLVPAVPVWVQYVNYLLMKVVVYEHTFTTFTFVVATFLDVLKKCARHFSISEILLNI